ncbi:hypothetical protein ABNX05_19605 [Lysinibacillus sp. M3]|uniref:Capsule biosynthesis protein n=1 Tax=Lysinibacillus zambalensis TaxID=3160866 RepID=A0ABV1MXF9_9BACI
MEKELSISLFENIEEIIIWGSGSGYEKWKEKINLNISYIVDSNPQKWGTFIDDIEIISPETLKGFDLVNTKFLILSFFIQEITEQIVQLGFSKENIFTFKHIERTVFKYEKKHRYLEFQNVNKYSLKDFIEKMDKIYSDLNYKNVSLNSIMLPYISLIASRLFLESSNEMLFPVTSFKPYLHLKEGPILVSFVWQEKRRPSHYLLIKKMIEQVPKKLISELVPASFYNEEEHTENHIIFKPSIFDFKFEKELNKLATSFKEEHLNLNKEETDWLLSFTKYFILLIDFAYEFFENNKYKIYISGFSNNSEENVFVQVANQLNIVTFNLQHGTYGKTEEFELVPYSHIYKYPKAKYSLLWGNYWKEVLRDVILDDSQLISVGNPIMNYKKNDRLKLKNSKTKLINKNVFLICFYGPSQGEVSINQQMLDFADEIAVKYNMKYIAKMHPENKVLPEEFSFNEENCIEFIKDNRNIHDLFNKVDFIICCSSTVIHEAVYYYIPVFVFNAHAATNSICGPLSTRFDFKDQLLDQIKKFLNKYNFNELLDEYDKIGEIFFEIEEDIDISVKYKNIFLQALD